MPSSLAHPGLVGVASDLAPFSASVHVALGWPAACGRRSTDREAAVSRAAGPCRSGDGLAWYQLPTGTVNSTDEISLTFLEVPGLRSLRYVENNWEKELVDTDVDVQTHAPSS